MSIVKMVSRIAFVAVVVASGGCQMIFGLDDPEPKNGVDAAVDSVVDVIDAVDVSRCFGAWNPVCFPSRPTSTAALPATVNTDAGSAVCEPTDRPEYCVIGRQGDLAVNSLRATGVRPLVVIATGTLTILGAVDASSRRSDNSLGPRAMPNTCNAAVLGNNHDGGAGGSFQGRGGAGGVGGGGSMQNSQAAAQIARPSELRGGCPGKAGNGELGTTENGGAFGSGGGAVYLVGGTRIAVSIFGSINASGAGGGGGPGSASVFGAGGGGSGGMIVLDAPTLAVTGPVFADGGGGGGGGAGTSGNPGVDPSGTTAASGGTGAGNGSTGGIGSHGASPTGATVTALAPNDGGGGGGGGGAGWILIRSTTTATTSPSATTF